MAVHWTLRFKSFLGTDYTVDIYDNDYSGSTPVQLTGGDQPFVTREMDDDDMYTPIRTQSGYLRFIVESSTILAEIQPVKATDRPVVLRNGSNVEWVGFLQPEQYNQPWIAPKYEIEVPLMSIMSAMQSVDFTQAEGYVSFFSLVRTINSYVPEDIYITAPQETPVKDVFVQNNNFREFLTIAERSERGTTNKYECTSVYEAVRAFCEYFGFSLHEYKDTFFCVVYPDTDIHYYDIAPDGSDQESQWGNVTMDWLTICGANNHKSYSNIYRRIYGEFETGRAKMEDVYAIGQFFKQFSVQGAYPTTAPRNLLFYGNAEIQPYKNNSQEVAWIADSPTDSGGQIIRKPDVRQNIVPYNGATWSDELLVFSQAAKAATPETALKLNIPTYIYLNSDEYAALNIDASVMPWYDVTQGEGFIKKLHCKLRIGEYWLNTIEQPGYQPSFVWTTTESACFLEVDENGAFTQHAIDYRANADMDKVSGFAIDMPSGLAAGYYDVYFELLANAEASADFSTYGAIGYLIHGLTFRVLRGVNSVSQPTPNFDVNTISRTTNGNNLDDYTVSSTITTKRGVQYGTGAALDENHAYITTKYDELGIVRRAAVMNKYRELLTVSVRNHTQPIDGVSYHSQKYGILSQTIDWRNDTNAIRIINLE